VEYHFSPRDLSELSAFQLSNPLGIKYRIDTSPGDSSVGFLDYGGSNYLTVMPIEGGFELSFESGESDSHISGPFSMELFKWPSWLHTYATLKDTLENAEEFIGGMVKRSDEINAYVAKWAGPDDDAAGLALAA
jgi:hypothetical protein